MNTTISNTLFNVSHQKSVIALLKSEKDLAFKEILASKTINENIKSICYRDRIFSPDITIWAFLSQVLSEDYSCQAAVARVIAFFATKGMDIPSSNTAAYSKARTRLSEEILPNLARSTAEQLEKGAHKDWLWRGRKIKLIDGSTISMPDTPENQSIYPQSSTQKPGVGFPIARIVAIISYATGALIDLAIWPYSGKKTGEHALLWQLMHTIELGDVVLGDAYYPSFFFGCRAKETWCRCCFSSA